MFDYSRYLSDIEKRRLDVMKAILRTPDIRLILYRGKFFVDTETERYPLTPSGIGLASLHQELGG